MGKFGLGTRAALEELRAQKKQLAEMMAQTDQAIAILESQLELFNAELVPVPRAGTPAKRRRIISGQSRRAESWPEATVRALGEAGRPLRTSEIVSSLRSAAPYSSMDQEFVRKAVTNSLSRRRDLFRGARRGRYTLIQNAPEKASPAPEASPAHSEAESHRSISEVIVDAVRSEPGLKSPDIAGRLTDQIATQTRSNDPKKIVLTRLGQLIQAGVLEKNAITGGIYPVTRAGLNGTTH